METKIKSKLVWTLWRQVLLFTQNKLCCHLENEGKATNLGEADYWALFLLLQMCWCPHLLVCLPLTALAPPLQEVPSGVFSVYWPSHKKLRCHQRRIPQQTAVAHLQRPPRLLPSSRHRQTTGDRWIQFWLTILFKDVLTNIQNEVVNNVFIKFVLIDSSFFPL